MIVIVMGVSGAGKTTVGAALAKAMACEFLDADDFHPHENVLKMAAGTPLGDLDRWPWLDRLNQELKQRVARYENVVLACSALKAVYRSCLACGIDDVRVVYLNGTFEFIRSRLASRNHHYMPASLLESQFATLEPPQDALEVDAALAIDGAIRLIVQGLARKDPARRP